MSHKPVNRKNGASNIPFMEITTNDEQQMQRRPSNISISSDGSEESIPVDAPLARQKRCSVDIDTESPQFRDKFETNGVSRQRNSYLDNPSLSESIQEISYVLTL